jgi:putative solute:sodium symporter small subunit
MTDNDTHDSIETDGGTASPAQAHQQTDYLNEEVNLLSPSTTFMRDHLRVVWSGFIVWALIVFGPVTLTAVAPGTMTSITVPPGFPLHYFSVGFVGPTGALVLAFWYARKRDALDEKYGIDHTTPETGGNSEGSADDATATDGGVEQ